MLYAGLRDADLARKLAALTPVPGYAARPIASGVSASARREVPTPMGTIAVVTKQHRWLATLYGRLPILAADCDLNCVFPLERLRELAAARRIARVAPRHIGTMGHILGTEERRLVTETAPAIARLLVDDGVDYVLAAPG